MAFGSSDPEKGHASIVNGTVIGDRTIIRPAVETDETKEVGEAVRLWVQISEPMMTDYEAYASHENRVAYGSCRRICASALVTRPYEKA